ncbi:hypothetical protein PIB30_056264 [Stylosanthes scabra]|uniref:Uncharacterized protein n=1 Tax=Stylosanthes scabra TaxID=79078 RepID=A0ABU6RJM7_9FABA|nr:hypothetical protein [Stylosanthes scabra]
MDNSLKGLSTTSADWGCGWKAAMDIIQDRKLFMEAMPNKELELWEERKEPNPKVEGRGRTKESMDHPRV